MVFYLSKLNVKRKFVISLGICSISALTFTLTGSMNSVEASAPVHFYQAIRTQYDTVWQELIESFSLEPGLDNASVQKWIDWYSAHPQVFLKFTQSASPWLHFVAQEVIKRQLPGELALLPFVESGYDPTASNANGSSGLWQFMPATARELGLHTFHDYAARRDVVASTKAALTYLQNLHDRYYPDSWKLALAAYNAGPRRVNTALTRAKVKDFWHLTLPQETKDYVPKLLALANIVNNPEKYGVALAPISNQPTFAIVDLPYQLTLKKVAQLAHTNLSKIRSFNPAFLGSHAHRKVLLPIEVAQIFHANLAHLNWPQKNHEYVVNSGDTLSAISARSGISIEQIKQCNHFESDKIHIGQTLILASTS